MKSLSTLAVFVCLFTFTVSGQIQPERRVIEVSGSAEQLVTPNEFTFKITLLERIENKQKITIEQQESSLRSELTTLGVDVAKDLSIYDISSTYFRQKKVKDVLGTKDYRLKIRDLNKIAQLQDLADRLNVGKLDLIKSDNTDMTRYRREVKIEALRAAKDKAQYLLEAIGEHLGKAVTIEEIDDNSNGFVIDGQETSNFRFGLLNSNSNITVDNLKGNVDSLSFSPTRIRFVIKAKFELQ